jgi:RNA-directed DNA polymerase
VRTVEIMMQREKESEMEQMKLSIDNRSLFEKLCSMEFLHEGFRAVKKNKGSPGVDGVTIKDFERKLEENLRMLHHEIKRWKYKPSPVRRVEIPKPGKNTGVRMLGVPCIRDRVVQATLKLILEPIFEPLFSDNSYGLRPYRSQKQAIKAAKRIINTGKEYVVDIDLAKFFDRIHHDRLISRLAKHVDEKEILRIIGMILRSGVMKSGVYSATEEGAVQGSPLSPLLSNIVLDELDKEIERRGIEFCRFADDCNIFVRSKKAAKRVMGSIGKYIETKMKLFVNKEKSKVALSKYVKFLGMTVDGKGKIKISTESMKRAMRKVKELTPRGTNKTMEKTIEKINEWYMGWSGYYRLTEYPKQLRNIESRVRRRLRARIIAQQKKKRHLYNKLIKRGINRKYAGRVVYCNDGRWVTSGKYALSIAYSVAWFINQMGQKIRSGEVEFRMKMLN